ncbi:hypothetical protein [Acidicapsa acidisoli]|uniref:hypothetical protein n=1 Tax=Acidicapsa acidisoli TaxID=1615681 RepID=UPI0021E0812E|nr:hypothetical protein [Acidicapsa acidisoli]
MRVPVDHPSAALSACITALIMCLFMPVLLWLTRKFFGEDEFRDGFYWGLVVVGPLSTRLLDPLFHSVFQ